MTWLVHVRCGFAALIECSRRYFCLCCRRDVPAWEIERWTRRA